MNRLDWQRVLGTVLLAALLLTACAPAATITPQVIIQTQLVEVEGTPQVQEVVVTATPGPATETPPTAEPTAAPGEPLQALGDGEGAVSIVAWAGYIERGETD